MNAEFFEEDKIKIKRIIQKGHDCYGIILENNIKDVDVFLKTSLPGAFRSNLNRLKKRLEMCFSIKYTMYCGSIKKDEYDYIMNSLIEMQVKRLNHQKIDNHLLNKYENYKKIAFSLINEKKASLFVIYNNTVPIGITLNFILDKVYFGEITTFDMNYSKFGIGNLLIYKQLSWCIHNNFEYFDMGNGEYEYKKKWCNHHYLIETHIIYSKNSLVARFASIFCEYLVKLKNVLKRINFHLAYKKAQKIFKGSKEEKSLQQIKYEFHKLESGVNQTKEIKKENFQDPKYDYLKKVIFDFLYLYKEHFQNVVLYSISNKSHTFILEGENHMVKCIILE
ncbi:GNAT family N-acetyltransferase [uncultured Algibacter sp.]|uniref:GNAT family N-acetyltransferase n=1 Tax=uncultured Algibacter sp. TaxID=298659 RepID=UPI00261C00D5|nr:GNAT family N-acetyltransferase [uncultured Algibacter sp.]